MESNEFEYTEKNIIKILAKMQRAMCTSYDVLIPNCYTSHDNEADLFAIRKSGLCDEFEVKISRSDFFNDAKKAINYRDCDWNGIDEEYLLNEPNWRAKKLLAPWQKLKYQALCDGDMSANYFWYAIKSGIVDLEEIPSFAGVIVIFDDGEWQIKRRPKKLHSNKMPFEERFRLARKLGYRFWDLYS